MTEWYEYYLTFRLKAFRSLDILNHVEVVVAFETSPR